MTPRKPGGVGKTRLKRLAVRELKVHPLAQRKLQETHVKRIMKEVDVEAMGTVHAVLAPYIGPGHFIVDGQHRFVALERLELYNTKLDVSVHIDAVTVERASQLFLRLNNRTAIRPLDKFRNRVQANDPTALAISTIVEAAGYQISENPRDNCVRCTTALELTYNLDRGTTLTKTLALLSDAWQGTRDSLDGSVVRGTALLLFTWPEIELPRFITKLRKYAGGPARLIGDGRGSRAIHGGPVAHNIAHVLKEYYNRGRRTNKLQGELKV